MNDNELTIIIITLMITLLWIRKNFNSLNSQCNNIKKDLSISTEQKIKKLQEHIQQIENQYNRLDDDVYNHKLKINDILEKNEDLLSKLRYFASNINNRFRETNETISLMQNLNTSQNISISNSDNNEPQEEPQITLGEEQQKILDFICSNQDNVLILGAAGTGKSTLAKQIKKQTKNICVVSPTGIAALNIQGSTIHSLFQLPPKDFLDKKYFSKVDIIEYIETILIDEISMVRPDILDVIDTICKKSKKSKLPFGGIRIIAIGDLCQLPPIIKKEVAPIFKKKYKHEQAYFFDANSFKKGKFKKFTLTQVYRQQDPNMLKHLNNIRLKKDSNTAIDYFNQFSAKTIEEFPNATIISPYKKIVETYNDEKLNALKTKELIYNAKVSGIIEEDPAPRTLRLKENALVMFTCNNHPLWVNGTTGIIKELQDDNIIISLFDGRELTLPRYVWKNYEYINNDKNIIQKEIGSFEQFPLQIGYAITIHKSQGKTLDSIILDKGRCMFASGQLYVALSRVKKSEDLHILRPIKDKDIIIDKRVIAFMNRK